MPRVRAQGRQPLERVRGREEQDILDKAFAVEFCSRLGCQAKVERDGLLEIELTRESIETYYNEHPQERHAREARLKAKP